MRLKIYKEFAYLKLELLIDTPNLSFLNPATPGSSVIESMSSLGTGKLLLK